MSGGIGMRISLPSLAGLTLSSELRSAFSIAPMIDGSKGWTVSSEASGAWIVDTWLSGICAPCRARNTCHFSNVSANGPAR